MKPGMLQLNRFPEFCTEIFLLILRAKTSANIGAFDTLQTKTKMLFQSFEKRCRDHGVDIDDIKNAKYALAAFVDEAVLNSSWPHKDKWADNPLQLEYFGTFLAGEIFFDKLDEIRAQAKSKPDLLEIYYLCLVLGFKGKYGVGNPELLGKLIDNVASELSRVTSQTPLALSPRWEIDTGPHGFRNTKLPRQLVVAGWVILALAVGAYFALFFVIRSDAWHLRQRIERASIAYSQHVACEFLS